MENQRLFVDKLREYELLNNKIQTLNEEYNKKENEVKKDYQLKYEKIKNDLNDYIGKIKKTVETVCAIYRDKVILRDGFVYFVNGQIQKASYTPFNAYEPSFTHLSRKAYGRI